MTRDEAIKVMRTGQYVEHKALPNQKFIIDADGSILVEYDGKLRLSSIQLHKTCFDNGWELAAKTKVKKTYWIAIFSHKNDNNAFDTSRAFPIKELAETYCCHAKDFLCLCPVEIEVEE